jgi:hypothetical protein
MSTLAKNQLSEKGSGINVIPALPNIGPTNSCPVRTLLKYLDTAFAKRLCFGHSIQKFLNMSDKNSSLPKSGPPERWIVLAIADL